MGLLADNNRKQKWSLDPRNQNWKNESNKEDGSNLGANLMRKLGWKTGEGLGKNGQGMTDNIKAHVKNNNYGIGMSTSNQKDWVAGQEDFNAVLRMLNDEDTSLYKQDKLKQKRAIQKKSLSAKFVKAKDLSSSSKADMQALFGSAGGDIFSQMAAATATETKKDEPESDSSDSDDEPVNKESPTIKDVIKSAEKNTSVSKVSTNDYFAQMMAKRGIKNPYAQPDLKKLGEAVDKAEVERVSFKKEVKPVGGIRQWGDVVNATVKTEEVENVEEGEKVEKDKKKKKKKRKAQVEEVVEKVEEVEAVEAVEEAEEEVISPPKKKKKKKNKSAEKEPEPVIESETEAVAEPAKKKKKKKKNKTKTDSE